VIHLAAQAGVRYSLQNPHAYVDSNLVGFMNILEGCRHAGAAPGLRQQLQRLRRQHAMPFSEHDSVDHPVSLYAATKKANELMAHTYSHLFGLPTTGLRFFTVYGPWGRPDMALFLFTKAILEGRPIDVFNHGKMQRDFTYVDDIVEGVIRVLDRMSPTADPATTRCSRPGTSSAPYRVFNIGNHDPVPLMDFIAASNTRSASKARRTSCRCRMATCRPPTPTTRLASSSPATARRCCSAWRQTATTPRPTPRRCCRSRAHRLSGKRRCRRTDAATGYRITRTRRHIPVERPVHESTLSADDVELGELHALHAEGNLRAAAGLAATLEMIGGAQAISPNLFGVAAPEMLNGVARC
jgi:nucleoside-diphosphate-sugar epimerase